jgi:hypothetical protein
MDCKKEVEEAAQKEGKTITPEQAALIAFCFNEAAKRGVSPLTLMAEITDQGNARNNLGRIDTNNGTPKKPSWQL